MDSKSMPPLMYPLRHTRLRILSEYLYELEQHIAEEITHYQDVIGKIVREEPSNRDLDAAVKEFEFLQRDYPRNLRYSFVMLIMATTDDALAEFCRSRGKQGGKAVKCRLEELGAIKHNAPVWNEVDHLRDVRNVIAHCGGRITSARTDVCESLQRFAGTEPEFTISEETGQMLLTKSFCDKALTWVDLLLNEIESGMKERIWMQESYFPSERTRE